MLRADMDALPLREETGLPYASTVLARDEHGEQVPVAHACGHDMHTACLAGAATVLSRSRDTWSGTLLVVFQPAEERTAGAAAMIDDGLLDRFPRPDLVLGQHVGPLPAGMIGHREGTVMAGADAGTVTLFGRGGHGSRPESTIDPVVMAAATVLRLQEIVAREVSPQDSAVVTVGRLQAGTKENIIPDTAELGISLRSYDDMTRNLLKAAVERVVRASPRPAARPASPRSPGTPPRPCWSATRTPPARSSPTCPRTSGPSGCCPCRRSARARTSAGSARRRGCPPCSGSGAASTPRRCSPLSPRGRHDQLPSNHSPRFAPLVEPTLSTGVEALVVAALGRFAAAGAGS